MDNRTEEWQRNQGELRMWLARYRAMHECRDTVICHARRFGIGVTEIAHLSGLSRGHVSEIIRTGQGGGT